MYYSTQIREHPDLGIYVEGLCELVVKSGEDVMTLLEQGGAVRRVAATNMNEHSSRSHRKQLKSLKEGSVERLL
jgi:kinesin family member 1